MNWCIKTFHELTNEELYQLLRARVDVFVVEQACPYPELDNYDQKAIHYFLKEGKAIVANVRILPKGLKYAEVSIGRVLVTANYRKKGLARELMQRAMTYANTEMDADQIKIQAQTYLKSFYQSLGFQPMTNTYMEDGIPHIDMLWKQK